MYAELIAIGSELVLGELVDTNSAYIARALRDIGLEVRLISAVGDDTGQIAALVREAATRTPVVITTGGLGPTVDDPTREAVAQAFGREVEYRPELWAQIEERFARFGRKPSENNRKQAYLPQGALALENPVGTAPCFLLEHSNGVVISLPGVPREMEHMLANRVLPELRQRFNLTGVIKAKTIRTIGMGESLIDEKIGDLEKLTNPTVGLNAHAGQVDIRITARATSEAEADALIAPLEARVRAELGDFVYGEGKVKIEDVVGDMLTARQMTVAVLESGTGAALATRLAALPHSAKIFVGMAPLSNGLSPESMLDEAEQLRAQLNASWGIAIHTDPEATRKAIALALVGANGERDQRTLGFGGPPALLGTWASTAALNILRLILKREA